MTLHRCSLLALIFLGAALAGCKKSEPVVVKPAAKPVVAERSVAAPPPRERGEYTDMPSDGMPGSATSSQQVFAAEAQRGGPRGEARIFENAQEAADLARGAPTKFMNGQFRYYLSSVGMIQPRGECKTPLLAVSLAVENVHGTPMTAIYGEFTFSQSIGADQTQAVAVPYRADILGPFSNKQGGLVYATAYLQPADAARDGERWARIAAINPQKLKVWFKPEAFYYANGTQYSQQTGTIKAQRDVLTCGGSEGSRSVLR